MIIIISKWEELYMKKNNRINILFIAHSSELHGGANRSLFSILKYFNSRNNINVIVLVPKSKGSFITLLLEENVEFITTKYYNIVTKRNTGITTFLRIIKLYLHYFHDLLKSVIFYKKIEKYKFNIIYTNTRVVFFGAFLAKRLKVPHILHVREFIQQNNLRSVINSDVVLDRLSVKLIAISKYMRTILSENISFSKITLIYNGLERQTANKKSFDFSKDINILIAGTLNDAKNQMDAVIAMRILQEKGYNNVNLYIAGSSSENNKKSYKNRLILIIKKENIQRVVFLGEVTNMKSLRNKIDIELICSSCEAFGRVIIEGMQQGNILIGANRGAIPEIIINMKNGLIYNFGDSNNLASKIIYLINNINITKKMSNSAMIYVENNFTIDKTLNSIENLFVEVLEIDNISARRNEK